jgi:hypothetical protein
MIKQQLELFLMLSPLLRPSRRLRRIGFEIEQLRRDVATLNDLRGDLDRNAAALPASHNTCDVVVKIEDARERIDAKLRDAREISDALERQLAKGIEAHLVRGCT